MRTHVRGTHKGESGRKSDIPDLHPAGLEYGGFQGLGPVVNPKGGPMVEELIIKSLGRWLLLF